MKWLLPASEQCAAHCLPPPSTHKQQLFLITHRDFGWTPASRRMKLTSPLVVCLNIVASLYFYDKTRSVFHILDIEIRALCAL